MSNEFYLTLPSNASMDIFPKNSQSHFFVKLPKEISLIGENWRCGLSEIHVPSVYPNVDSSNNTIRIEFAAAPIEEKIRPEELQKRVVQFETKVFLNAVDLFAYANEEIEKQAGIKDLFRYYGRTIGNAPEYVDIALAKDHTVEFLTKEQNSFIDILDMHQSEVVGGLLNLKPRRRSNYLLNGPSSSIEIYRSHIIHPAKTKIETISIDVGWYDSLGKILNAFQDKFSNELKGKIRLQESFDKKVKVIMDNRVKLYLTKDLEEMLGMDREEINTSIKSKYPADISKGGVEVFLFIQI